MEKESYSKYKIIKIIQWIKKKGIDSLPNYIINKKIEKIRCIDLDFCL